ncbi:DegT/DnrJ/EryC1/StrS family aminotransferase [Geobacter sp. AOG1]|uniref:DegT/DnrJ/EryC1/StrS family aminotransferase n=1 Tax=Geobacter sp. AOG1 TaxID=1566346 RepID=UPI001E1AB27D|nr:UDP-2-acetamido-2-deoxy-alpha-D-ribo-hexopyranos-3-ulose 3-aminotransferase [Geobacter sp. AOG1]
MIPMVDLKIQYEQIKEEIDNGLLEALGKTQFILGPNVTAFEQETAAYLGVPHAVGVASGTDALHLALAAAGIGPGDEVITSPFTFIATAEAICYVGATPVFVDVEPGSFNIDPALVAKAITPRTKALLPVHLFGQPANIGALQELCDKHNLLLIEDCAQSFGAAIGGKMTGSFGLAGCFSFFPSKNLGGYGDGGLVTTTCDETAERLRMLRNHGSKVRYHHDAIGYNSRLDELQAVILRVKLKRIDTYNRERRRVAHRYSAALAPLGITPPMEDGIGNHVYHQYTLLSDRRDAIMAKLGERQIASAIYYPIPLHKQNVFAAACAGLSLPVSEGIAARCLSLPIFPEMTDAQVDEVLAAVRDALA